ncbi:WXG100 family type VII secretion target [Nocardiopsis alborubida]|uniref:WXG100 family type VII secretion target n=1 Tax=Nocardiopsis alborubida TaxID=146802 RepID=A0A7X6MJK4_9ACTN|nr:WXG100 family type VII secretion target [Nocardiopsis alborubida]NKZ00964.1 WXG100 family type VII secretion target [Nocardiopsis alborubida]
MTINGFDVSYGEVDQATMDLDTQTKAVRNQIESLDTTMQSLKAQLDGAMFEQYQIKVEQWRSNVADMEKLLGAAKSSLDQIRHEYSGTDNREAMNWQGLL